MYRFYYYSKEKYRAYYLFRTYLCIYRYEGIFLIIIVHVQHVRLLFHLFLMQQLIVAGHDIERYLPSTLSDDSKELIARTAQAVVDRIDSRLPVGLRYNGEARIIHPYSAYLQSSTLRKWVKTPDPVFTRGLPWQHKAYALWARRIVWLDGYQTLSEWATKNGWRSIHLDRIDDLSLLSSEELREIFVPENDRDEVASLERYLDHRFVVWSTNFAQDDSKGNRIFLAQVDTWKRTHSILRK